MPVAASIFIYVVPTRETGKKNIPPGYFRNVGKLNLEINLKL